MFQQISSLKCAIIIDVGHRSHLKLLFEKPTKILWIHVKRSRQVFQIDFLVIMLMDIPKNLLVLCFPVFALRILYSSLHQKIFRNKNSQNPVQIAF